MLAINALNEDQSSEEFHENLIPAVKKDKLDISKRTVSSLEMSTSNVNKDIGAEETSEEDIPVKPKAQRRATPSENIKKRDRDSPQKESTVRKSRRTASKESLAASVVKSSTSLHKMDSEKTMSISLKNFAELLSASLRETSVKEALGELIDSSVGNAVKNSLSNMNTRLVQVETATTKRDDEITALKTKTDTLEQQLRLGNLVFSGFPERENETTATLQTSFSEFCGNFLLTIVTRNDVEAIYRMGKKNADFTPPRVIMVKFSNRRIREEIYHARMQLRKMETGRGHDFTQPVYINEDLTQYRATIYKECREAVKDKKLFSAWSMNGFIWVKQAKEGSPIRINEVTNLQQLTKDGKTIQGRKPEHETNRRPSVESQ